jgi:hypothetical protein
MAVLLLAESVKISIRQPMGNSVPFYTNATSGRSFGFMVLGIDISVTK